MKDQKGFRQICFCLSDNSKDTHIVQPEHINDRTVVLILFLYFIACSPFTQQASEATLLWKMKFWYPYKQETSRLTVTQHEKRKVMEARGKKGCRRGLAGTIVKLMYDRTDWCCLSDTSELNVVRRRQITAETLLHPSCCTKWRCVYFQMRKWERGHERVFVCLLNLCEQLCVPKVWRFQVASYFTGSNIIQ